MGGRHSSQNSNHNQRQAPAHTHRSNPVRFSVSSLETVSGRAGTSLPSGQGTSNDLGSSPSDRGVSRRRRRRDRNNFLIETQSLPAHLFPTFLSSEIKCPVCNKRIASDEIESHLLTCLSKPRISYNEDILKTNAGECIICFEDLVEGDRIARLPCFCIYHKKCLDDWFQRNRCCPEHPDQIPSQDVPIEEENLQAASTSLSTNTPTASGSTISSQNFTSLFPNNPDIVGATASSVSHDQEASNSDLIPNIVPLTLDLNDENAESDSAERQNLSPSSQFSNIQEALSQNSSYVNLNTSRSEDSIDSPQHKRVVHVDDGSVHGSPTLFNDDDLAQLASKIKTILVAESPRPLAESSENNT